MKPVKIIHPFLFALFPIVSFWAHNAGLGVKIYGDLLGVAVMSAAGTLVLWAGLSALLRDVRKAGLITTVFLFIFFSYGHFYKLIDEVRIPAGGMILGPDKILMGSSFVILACGVFFILRFRGDLTGATRILNVTGVILMVIPFLQGAGTEYRRLIRQPVAMAMESHGSAGETAGAQQTQRDIYYIILDSYANSATLSEIYGMDNGPMEKYLQEKGFKVASESFSNYSKTFLSMSATLNMRYIDDVADDVGLDSKDQSVPWDMVSHNQAAAFLKSRGYKYINLSINPHKIADLNLGTPFQGREFQMVFIRTTMLKPFMEKVFGQDSRERILYSFAKLQEIPAMAGPKFIYAHIMCPHPPFLFDRDGNAVPQADNELFGSVWKDAHFKYTEQVRFVNARIKPVIEAIQEKSAVAPIIIIQGDHGAMASFQHDGYDTERTPTEENMRDMMRIFNAYYLPEGEDIVYDGISPVNSFRVIFDHYFGADLPLLEDRSFYSTNFTPYQFDDVTDIVKFQ